jgi:UDP-N-acetylmuramyl tripeptide synthase
MKRLIAIWLGKLLTVAGKIMGKKSSSGPGAIALKLCPAIVDDINKIVKNKVIITCGTNGKTTTNNIMCSALEAKGYTVLCNGIGANMLSGVATAYVQEADWLGRIKADYACFEVDEAYTPIVFKHVKPDVVVVTNLFRDQLDRYGEIDITVKLIKKALAGLNNVKVVLNSDDPVSVQFGLMDNVEPIYYGISQKVMPQTAAAKEGKFCPVCGKEQQANRTRCWECGVFFI